MRVILPVTCDKVCCWWTGVQSCDIRRFVESPAGTTIGSVKYS